MNAPQPLTEIRGGFRSEYARSVEEEQEDARGAYYDLDLQYGGHIMHGSLREATNGPLVIPAEAFVKLMWVRISHHKARVSQQKLALSRLL